jgi:hypothetical protein
MSGFTSSLRKGSYNRSRLRAALEMLPKNARKTAKAA